MMKTDFTKFEIEKILTADLNKAEWNYKQEDAAMAMKLIENLKRNGILQVSIVYEDDAGLLTVLDGNHRLDAYVYLEIKEVPCVMLGAISLNEARRIAVEVNETKFDANKLQLAETLREIKLEFDDEDLRLTLPFTSEELGEFEALIDIDFDVEEETDVNFKARKKHVECPNCDFKFKV